MELIWGDWRNWSQSLAAQRSRPKPPLPPLALTPLSALVRWDSLPADALSADTTAAAASFTVEPAASTAATTESAMLSPHDSPPPAESSAAESVPPVPFELHPLLNHKIVLMQGDVLGLQVDAIVHSSNERLTDVHSAPAGSLAHRLSCYAGDEYTAEAQRLVSSEGGVATGDAMLVSSHALGREHGAARFVIHTTSPKYSQRYQVAAENALHGCFRRTLEELLDAGLHSVAFPLVHAAHKDYPLDAAAHIACRTLRKFLERYGRDSLHTVVLCFQRGVPIGLPRRRLSAADSGPATASTSADSAAFADPAAPVSQNEDDVFAVYKRILPLYFPRTLAEEELQRTQLPPETGSELGDTVLAERQVRITYGQFIASGPRPFSEDERKHSSSEAASTSSGFSNAAYVAPAHRTSAATMPVPMSAAAVTPVAPEYLSPTEYPTDTFARRAPAPAEPIVCTDTSSFSAAQEGPDATRLRQLTAGMTSAERALAQEESHRYQTALKHALDCTHTDMDVLDAARYVFEGSRRDHLGRRIVYIVGARVPAYHADGRTRVQLQHLEHHLLRTLDPLISRPCVLVYFHAGVDHTNSPPMSFFRRLYSLFPRSHDAHVRALYVVHPTLYLRGELWLLASLVTLRCWSRIVYVHSLDQLHALMDTRALDIPAHVLKHDVNTFGAGQVAAIQAARERAAAENAKL